MIEFDCLEMRNFLSYSDYATKIELSKLGQCLITGEIVDGVDDGRTQVNRSNGAGKCLDGDSLIQLANGNLLPIRDANLYVGSKVCCIDSNLKNSVCTILGHSYSGNRHCFRLELQSGRQIICSADHRFLTFRGWKALRDIRIRDNIAAHVTNHDVAILGSDILWDEVKAINYFGCRDTYDIEVSKLDGAEPNFSANDIITHNSTIANAILWCLFGRTMHSANPGDKVINWHTGKDCVVSLKLKNGDIITRTRKTKGHDELLLERNGEQILSTLSTTTNQQQEINKHYHLDWELLCGSSFFTQYNKSWLEMPDQQRKNAIERMTRLDRFTYYATIAKEKLAKVTADHEKSVGKRENILRMMETIGNEIKEAQVAELKFEKDRSDRVDLAVKQALDYKAKRDAIIIPDIEQLKGKWQIIEQIRSKRRDIEKEIQEFQFSAESKIREKKELQNRIFVWTQKAGKLCMECSQEIKQKYVQDKVAPFRKQITTIESQTEEFNQKIKVQKEQIIKIDEKVTKHSPEQTIREAETLKAQHSSLNEAARKWAENAKAIKVETNPHITTIDRLKNKLSELDEEIDVIKETLHTIGILVDHINYIARSYSDRKKIKSFGVERYRPILNERLSHYMGMFGLDVKLKLSESLSVESDGWGYDFMSGGERKRIDISFMLAMFDLNQELYGKQSNLIVLDEVDGRLDNEGIQLLTNIIKSDLANRVETILIISHRNQMRDVFPHQIIVRKQDNISIVSEVR